MQAESADLIDKQNRLRIGSGIRAALPAVCLILMLAGCESYHRLPLTNQAVRRSLAVPSWKKLRQKAAYFARIAAGQVQLQPKRGLLPSEAAIIAVLVNPDLREIRDARGEAAAQLLQAGILPNPQLSESTDFVTGGFTQGTFNAYGLSLNWNLSRLIDRQARIAAARYQCGRVDLEIAWREWQTAIAAKLAVYNLTVARTERQQAVVAATELAKGYAIARKAYAEHLSTVLEFNAARAASRQANDLILKLNQTMTRQRLALTRVLGVPPHTPVHVSRRLQLPSRAILPAEGLLVKDMERYRPDLLALQMGYKSQEERLRAAILRQFPNISIGFQQASDNTNVHTTGFGVTVDLPIFDHNQGNIAIQKASRQALFDAYAARVFAARSDIAVNVANVRELSVRISALEKSVRSLASLVRRYRQALRVGNTDVVSYYALISELVGSRIRLIALKGQLEQNVLALELASGQYLDINKAHHASGAAMNWRH